MNSDHWKFKRFYFYTSFAVIMLISIGMGSYFTLGKFREFRQYALNDKQSNIENKRVLLQNVVDGFVQQVNTVIDSSEATLQRMIRNRVNVAHQIATGLYESMDGYSETEKREVIKSALATMIFKDNYIFVFNTDGVIVSSPLLPHLEGKDRLSQQDSEGNYTVRDAISIVNQRGEGYQTVYWEKPDDSTGAMKHKLVFLKKFEPFNWVIGFGIYTDEYEREVQEGVLTQLAAVKYENDGYLFATTYDGVSLTKPAKGKNMYDVQDVNGKYIVRELIARAKEGGGYVEYVMPPFKGARPETKLSYSAPVERWGWYIGTGMYLTDIEAAYAKRLTTLKAYAKKEILVIILATGGLVLLGGVLVFIFSGRLQKLVDSYSKEINEKNDELEELNESLEAKVEEKTAELNALNQSLEQRIVEEVEKNREKDRIMFQQGRLAAMGEMIGNIAHQWRQPLSSISLLIQDIEEAKECGELDDEYLKGTVSKCTQTIGHMSDTIDNFRYFFSPEKDKATFCVNEEITKCLSLLDAGLENNNIKVTLDLSGDGYAHGVPGEYAQVVVNIINNAKDVLLSRHVQSPEISIKSYAADGEVYVTICDNGGGVDSGNMEKIFEPYFTTKADGHGTGIGLYFSKMIIEGNMSGHLTVENAEQGAMFTIAVPAA